MEHVFSLRLDQETSLALQKLAEKTFRSRAGVVRLLIHQARLNPNLVLPSLSTPASEYPMESGEKEVLG